MNADWQKGFAAGWNAAVSEASDLMDLSESSNLRPIQAKAPAKRKRKQTGKAKILTDMTKPVWDKYKKGSGKKTYFDIRSQVQRSLKYKKKTKGM